MDIIDFNGEYSDLSRYTSYKAANIEWELWQAVKWLKYPESDINEAIYRITEAITHAKELGKEIEKRDIEINQKIADELQKMHAAEVYNGGIF